MNLPVFDLPVPNLGIDIPVLMHPPVVHFAIVIPVFILLLEIINLVMKRRGLTITTFVFFTLLMVIYFAAFVTGKTDGSETWDMLSQAGQADLKEHKLIGIYLMLGTVVIFFLKLFSMALRTWWMKLLYLLALIGFVAAVLYQGKEGGELVYKHGANNEMVQTLSEEVFDLKEELEEMKEESEAASEAAAEETKAPEATAPEKAEEKAAPAATTPAETEKEEAPQESNATQTVEQKAQTAVKEATEAAEKKAEEVAEKAAEAAEKGVDAAKETAKDLKDAAVEGAKKMMSTETPSH